MVDQYGLSTVLAYMQHVQNNAEESVRRVITALRNEKLLTVGAGDNVVRFLAPFRETYRAQSQAFGVEEAWLYGLTRQESRFVANAKSSAGAQGLMQLMPGTAAGLGVTNPWDPAQNIDGGVRYLAQGNIGLVREALHERTAALTNAPHVAQPLGFVVPAFSGWQGLFYGLGLKLYDALAARRSLGPTAWLTRRETVRRLPTVRTQGLWGGVHYWDGQFDDARLALLLARRAAVG